MEVAASEAEPMCPLIGAGGLRPPLAKCGAICDAFRWAHVVAAPRQRGNSRPPLQTQHCVKTETDQPLAARRPGETQTGRSPRSPTLRIFFHFWLGSTSGWLRGAGAGCMVVRASLAYHLHHVMLLLVDQNVADPGSGCVLFATSLRLWDLQGRVVCETRYVLFFLGC